MTGMKKLKTFIRFHVFKVQRANTCSKSTIKTLGPHTWTLSTSVFVVNFKMELFAEIVKVRLSSSKKVGFICINESPFQTMKNTFYFILKALVVLNMFCPGFFGHIGKWLDKKVKVSFKIYDVIYWEINNCNTHIAHYLKK